MAAWSLFQVALVGAVDDDLAQAEPGDPQPADGIAGLEAQPVAPRLDGERRRAGAYAASRCSYCAASLCCWCAV